MVIRLWSFAAADRICPGKFSTAHAITLDKAGGAFGIITALVAFYVGTAQMLADTRTSYFVLPLGQIPPREVV